MPMKETDATAFSRRVVQAFDSVNGETALTRTAHLQSASTEVTVRFSDFAGVPTIADNSPDASPRGMATRFHLGEHIHTDITAHSVDGFPARTAEEFVEFLNAISSSPRPVRLSSPVPAHLAT
jgi:catalase